MPRQMRPSTYSGACRLGVEMFPQYIGFKSNCLTIVGVALI